MLTLCVNEVLTEFARDYGINDKTVRDILNGKKWVHVIDTRLDNVGACCTDGGPVDP